MAAEEHMSAVQIERLTGRQVTIDSIETYENLAKCLAQDQSPLFSLLPREIRDLIWAFATAPYEDPRHPYDETEYYYRPGHTARCKSETQLLLTCRRIWLEANRWPLLQAEQCFWYYRQAPDGRSRDWMGQLRPNTLLHLGSLHLYAQMFAIEKLHSGVGNLKGYFFHPAGLQSTTFQPRMLHVTIRHTDWWNWEDEVPLRFQDSWLQALLDSPDLRSTQTLKLELETLDYKVAQLLPIIRRLERLQSTEFETHEIDGRRLATKFVLSDKKEEYDWSGPVNIDKQNFGPYKNKTELKYHVITLTWKLIFPQLPNAHIPTARLAPRLPDTLPSSTPAPTHVNRDPDRRLMEQRRNPQFVQSHFEPRSDLPVDTWFSRFGDDRNQRKSVPLRSMLLVRMRSVYDADMHERTRRAMFVKAMESTLCPRTLEEQWKREGSLLRFIE